MPTNPWLDPRTIIGICGFLFGIVSHFWNRRESRLDALSNVLKPMIRAAQNLTRANECRRKCEQLKVSFPNGQVACEAVERVNKMVEEYDEYINTSSDEFREVETELVARSFRFPDKITELVRMAFNCLAEYGRLVNEGFFEKADLQFAKFRDDYKQITKVGRGWRLADPFEGIRKIFHTTNTEADKIDKWELSKEEMDAILELVHKRVTTQSQNTYAVHPPQKLLDKPEIATSDTVVDELEDSVFSVVFQDGTTKMMTLVELVVFTYNLIMLKISYDEASRMVRAIEPQGNLTVQISETFSIENLMRPEMVKALLSKIEFAKTASDD
jgi:hypothetical protein